MPYYQVMKEGQKDNLFEPFKCVHRDCSGYINDATLQSKRFIKKYNITTLVCKCGECGNSIEIYLIDTDGNFIKEG